jgi:hypothetical protein
MKFLSKISLFFIYIVSIFGAIDIITDGIKPTPNAILFIFALLAFGTQLFYKKRLLLTDIMIFAFALLSVLGFALFISDLIFHPISIANDCEGHKPSREHYFDIMLIGLSITFVFGFIFLKTHKQKSTVDRIFSLIFISILVLCYSEVAFFKFLDKRIDKVSRPEHILPKGC